MKNKNNIFCNCLVDPTKNITFDFAGVQIKKNNHNFTIDHIYPQSGFEYSNKQGSSDQYNCQAVSCETNEQKSNNNNGHIVIEYDEFNAITEYEVRKLSKLFEVENLNDYNNQKQHGIIFIKNACIEDDEGTREFSNIENTYFYMGLLFEEKQNELHCYAVNFKKTCDTGILYRGKKLSTIKKKKNGRYEFPNINKLKERI